MVKTLLLLAMFASFAFWMTNCTPTTPTSPFPTGSSNISSTISSSTYYQAVYSYSFGSAGTNANQFSQLSGVLVRPDATALYAVENGGILYARKIHRFIPSGGSYTLDKMISNGGAIRFIDFDSALNVFGMDNTFRLINFNATTLLTNNITTAAVAFTSGSSVGEFAAGGTPAQATGIGGVCFDRLGNWWIADLGNNRLQKFNGTNGVGGFNFSMQVLNAVFVTPANVTFTTFSAPFSVRLDFNGNIAVVDSGNNRIAIVNTSGTTVNSWGGGSGVGAAGLFNRPMDIATNTLRQYFVTDYYNNRVQRFDESGNFLESFGSFGTGAGQFSGPVGISIDSYNTIYVVDQGNSRIQVWSNQTTTVLRTNQVITYQ